MKKKSRLPSPVSLRANLLRKLREKWQHITVRVEIVHAGSWRILYLYHPVGMENSNRATVTGAVKKCLRKLWPGSFFFPEDESSDPKRSSGEHHFIYLLSPLPQEKAYAKFQELYPSQNKSAACPFWNFSALPSAAPRCRAFLFPNQKLRRILF